VEESPSVLRGWMDRRRFKSEGLGRVGGEDRGRERKQGVRVKRERQKEGHTGIPLPLQIIILLLQLCK